MSKQVSEHLTKYVEWLVSHGDLSYMEAVLEYCERYNLDPRKINGMLPKSLKQKIEADAKDLNYLPDNSQKLF